MHDNLSDFEFRYLCEQVFERGNDAHAKVLRAQLETRLARADRLATLIEQDVRTVLIRRLQCEEHYGDWSWLVKRFCYEATYQADSSLGRARMRARDEGQNARHAVAVDLAREEV